IRASFEIEEGSGGFGRTLLARWHAEAAGTKIRYVPAGIPDLLRTDELIEYEAGITNRAWNRRPAKRATVSTIRGGPRPTWKSACRATRCRSLPLASACGATSRPAPGPSS